MAVTEAIILAGGLGTRLRSAVPDLPKCMAPVNNRPFLKYVIDQLLAEGIQNFIFSLGYKHEAIEAYLTTQFPTLSFSASIEDEPLGTGGAIQLALQKATQQSVLVTNGDTLFKASVVELSAVHMAKEAHCTLALKPMHHFNRYGVVELNADHAIASFHEKKLYEQGLINGGLYLVNKNAFLNEGLPQKFSFEKDYLEAFYKSRKMFGVIQDAYFIDIGIPEDFARAQVELKN
jgi:D-glycero-alpha-D-manno-heptose 1-phosphate guanylyltransferase